jgi:hypothetical protein
MRNTPTVVAVPSPSLPLFPLGTVLLPGSPLPLRIFEPRYRQLVADLLELPVGKRGFGVVAIREGHEVGPDSVRALYDVGCLALVTDIEESADGTFEVASVGTTRFRVTSLDRERPYLRAAVDWLPEDVGEAANLPAAVSYRYAEYHATLGTLYGRPPAVLPRRGCRRRGVARPAGVPRGAYDGRSAGRAAPLVTPRNGPATKTVGGARYRTVRRAGLPELTGLSANLVSICKYEHG